MHFTVQHTRLFRLVYCNPQQSNVDSRIVVSIKHRIAVFTLKYLAFTISYMETIMASLTCVWCRYSNQFNIIHQAFVDKEVAKLMKTPFSHPCSEFLSFVIGRKSNSRQVLNGNTSALGLSKLNDVFRNSVIDNRAMSSFFARKPFQNLFSVLCAFALKRTAHLLSFFSIILKFFGIKRLAITQRGNIHQSHINSNKFFNVLYLFIGKFNSLEKKVFSFSAQQISFAFNVWKPIWAMADKRNLGSTVNCGKRNNIVGIISHYSTVISNCPHWSKHPFNLFINLVTIRNLCNGTYNELSRKFKRGLDAMISKVMEFKCVKGLVVPRYIGNFITSIIELNNCISEQFCLLIQRDQLYFQCQFHNAKIIHLFEKVKYYLLTQGERQFLPAASYGVSLPKHLYELGSKLFDLLLTIQLVYVLSDV